MNGSFVVFEGPDGCGKSTMLDRLQKRGYFGEAVFVRDPGGTNVGTQIREILLSPDNSNMCDVSELLLYAASRAQLVHEVIRPTLESGVTVVSDRFYLSTLVYQSISGVLPDEELLRVVRLGVGELRPDCWVLLDVPSHVGMKRIGKDVDRMEARGVEFQEEVRRRYLEVADEMDDVVCVVDASRPVEEVEVSVVNILEGVL